MLPSSQSSGPAGLNPCIKTRSHSDWPRRAGSGFLMSSACGFGSPGLMRNQASLPHMRSPHGKISTTPDLFSVSQRPWMPAGAAIPPATATSNKAIDITANRMAAIIGTRAPPSSRAMARSRHGKCMKPVRGGRAGWCRPSNHHLTGMEALFIGQAYIDITFVTDTLPTGDEKTVARDYAVSFGGNAVTAAFCCAKLGIAPDLLASVADDWLGRMFIDMAAKYRIPVHHRKVAASSLSFVMPRGQQRAIVRCRDDDYKHPYPPLH